MGIKWSMGSPSPQDRCWLLLKASSGSGAWLLALESGNHSPLQHSHVSAPATHMGLRPWTDRSPGVKRLGLTGAQLSPVGRPSLAPRVSLCSGPAREVTQGEARALGPLMSAAAPGTTP